MFIDRIKENCEKLKDKTAYICENESLTYGELWKKAASLAGYLQKSGKSPVIVYGHKSPYMIISFLACIISGRAYVPCDISTPLLRTGYIISAVKSKIMLATETPEPININVLNMEALRQICDSEYECAISKNRENTAYIIFTSGSTGTPKGVPITIKNLENFITWATRIPVVSDLQSGVVFNQAAFSFDLSVADIYISLVCGYTLFASTRHEQEDLALLFKRLSQSGSALIVCTPTFMQMCLCDSAFNIDLLPELKTVFFCGEVLPVKTVKKLSERFPSVRILNAYGPTESTCAVCAAEVTEDMLAFLALPVGKIDSAAVEITIVDGSKKLPDGKRGEIMLHGASVSDGYLDNSGSSFRSGGYFFTGDIGKIENGYLYCFGRKDGQIKYKGYRIDPMEIEYCINEIEGIANAVVVPIDGNQDRILMLAAFVEKTDQNITAKFVKTELLKKLPSYMVPKTIAFVDKLHMNANGKCDREALKEIIFNGRKG